MLLDWRSFSLPPNAGGLRDQPYGSLERMRIAGNAYDAWRMYKRRPPGWERSPKWMWKMNQWIKESLLRG